MHPNEQVLRDVDKAQQAGDIDTFLGFFTDDVVMHVTGRSSLAGDYKGKDQVFGFFGKLMELTDGTSKVEVHDLLANDEHGVAVVKESGTRNGRSHEGNATHVFHIRDGKVTEFWDAQVDQYAADEFWA